MKPHSGASGKRRDGVWYDSMKHWAANTGRLVSEAERAKATPGTNQYFKSGRVSEKLGDWIDANPANQPELLPLKERLESERLEKQNRKLEFDYQVKMGQYVKIDDVKAKWATAMEAIMDVMKTLMAREDYNAAIKQIKANVKALDL